MLVLRTKAEVRTAVAEARATGARIGLVPTMGALHDGHMALVSAAQAETDWVMATIFVNPTQFEPNEDLATYPRSEARDLEMLSAAGVRAVFAPTPDEVYAKGAETVVSATKLSKILVGALRPGHFDGVATVVTKLFNVCQPDTAFFGEKDYQQLTVIRTMVRDLDVPVTIHGVPTVREPDGLAMSSRNVRLTPEDRAAAPVLSQALMAAEAMVAGGPVTVEALTAEITRRIADEPRADLRSVDIRDATSLAALEGALTRPAVILLAARFGEVLLIDQRVVALKESP